MTSSPPVTEFRMATPHLVRMVGGLFVLLAVTVFVGTFVVAALGRSLGALILVVIAATVLIGGLAWWLRTLAIVRFDADGYRVRLVRGAGVTSAGWLEVSDAATTHSGDEPVVVLTLGDGRRTTIPVGLLDVDREEFVRQLQRHLQDGQGLRPLS